MRDHKLPKTPEQIAQLKQFVLDYLDAKQATDIMSFEALNNIASHIIIASGRSARNISAIAEDLSLKLKHDFQLTSSAEGLGKSEWVLLNVGEILIHLFTPATRLHYTLEELYNLAPPKQSD